MVRRDPFGRLLNEPDTFRQQESVFAQSITRPGVSHDKVRGRTIAFALLLTLAGSTGDNIRGQEADRDGVARLVRQVEQAIRTGQPAVYLELVNNSANQDRAREFARERLLPDVTRVVVKERSRVRLAGTPTRSGYRLLVDVFAEYGARAAASTWRLDVKRVGASGSSEEWRIADQEHLTSIEDLYRLSLNATRQYDARNLTVTSEDLELTLESGSVFVADTDQGETAVVLLGRGDMRFHPAPDTEKDQVKIFCGREMLESRFDAAFIRVSPAEFQRRFAFDRLTARPVDPRDFRRADVLFREGVSKSFAVDLGDLSTDSWSMLPSIGDFVAEIRTRRFETLTYAKSDNQPENISLFDRRRRRNISLYASAENLARRGRFYNEDDLADYDVLDYDIDLDVQPERQWLEGSARLRLKVKAPFLTSLTLKLADSLVARSVVSDRFGRLLFLRVRNQNSIVLNLPTAVPRDTELGLTIAYAGELAPQTPDREAVALTARSEVFGQKPDRQPAAPVDRLNFQAEPSYLYSNRSLWYPQAGVSDYATAKIRLQLPISYDCVASGDLVEGLPFVIGPVQDPVQARRVYQFTTGQPLRYLAFIVSRFIRADSISVALDPRDTDDTQHLPLHGASYDTLRLSVEATARLGRRGREIAQRAADVARFYATLLGDYPFPSFTVALIESDLPGGHSPGYFAALNEPLPTSLLVWRDDPAAFKNYPEFFVAHEVAHQWWGQAVGWRNYHEQWLSEAFSQYFAALYAQHQRGDEVFSGVLSQLQRFGMEQSDQGPIYLGYRLGHVRSDSRIFRAVVYNKGAAVLHMLRRLVGDDAFFRGLRRFYWTWRFKKAGTDDFRAAMETEATRPLDRFFERWIYGSTLPRLRFSYRTVPGENGQDVVLHLEQVGELFDVPVTVTLQYADKRSADVTVAVADRVVEKRVALTGALRSAEIRTDDGMLAEIVRD
jgi:hypothetical protein